VLGLCDRFRCLPERGSLLDQDASILRLVRIADMGQPEAAAPDPSAVFGG